MVKPHTCSLLLLLLLQANLDEMVALCEEQLQRRARSATLQELSALAAAEADTAAALQTISSSSSGSSGCDDRGQLGSSSCCLDCNTYVTPAWWSLKVSPCQKV
jgi:hypothetical protein